MTEGPPPHSEEQSETLFAREDVLPRAPGRWSVLVPGTRVRLGAGAVALLGVVVGGLALSVLVFPQLIVSEPADLDQLGVQARVAAETSLEQTRNAVRTTLVQAIGGALVLLTFAVALGQLITARRGQVIDRFTNAIEQLGSDKDEVRLGGIYALDQIAADRDYARQIAEILAAYLKTQAIRERTSAADENKDTLDSLGRAVRMLIPGQEAAEREPVEQIFALRPDLQAVLRILILDGLWKRATLERLDLSGITVPRAELPRAELAAVVLLGATLRQADLRQAEIRNSDLSYVNVADALLDGATFERVDLTGGTLVGARLNGARLHRVNLKNANLARAQLLGAEVSEVDLSGADLTGGSLNSAVVTRSTLTGATLVGAQFQGATIEASWFIKADLSGADFSGAVLQAVDLTGASLRESIGLDSAEMDEATKAQVDELLNASPLA